MRRVLAVGAAVACGLALCIAPAGASTRAAGNGEAQKSASKILADAKAATASSKTVRVAGTVIDDGKEISLDLVSAQGSGGGTVTRDGTTINVVIIPPNVYLKADAASWTKLAGSAAAGQLLADKWLQTTTADENFGSFAKLLDISQLTDSIGANGKAVKAGTGKFHGTSAVILRGPNHGKLYVASNGKPYILGVVGTGAKEGSEVRFTQYDSAKVPSEPTDAISLSQLTQSSGQTS